MPTLPPVLPALRIGPLLLSSPLVLAPLAGYTDLAFRLHCRECGASLCYSEMISSHGLVFAQSKSEKLLRTDAAERPFAVQLFGSDPEIMAGAAALVSAGDVDFIDLNMGCPVRKVIKKGSGAALMRDPDRAERIIVAVRAATSLPVTIKIRSGWTHDAVTAPQFAAMAEAAGAAAVTVHGRTWAQGFGGKADWEVIAAVKKAVSIPVIGNGDVLSFHQAVEMMAATGCDGVMIGRGALGNPWVFSREGRPPLCAGRLPALLRYLELAERYLESRSAIFRVKYIAGRYLGGLPNAAQHRQAISLCTTFDDLRRYLLEQSLEVREEVR